MAAMAVCADSSSEASASFLDAIAFSLNKLCMPEVSLKEEQRSAFKAIYEGKDVFVCLPTGYGLNIIASYLAKYNSPDWLASQLSTVV